MWSRFSAAACGLDEAGQGGRKEYSNYFICFELSQCQKRCWPPWKIDIGSQADHEDVHEEAQVSSPFFVTF